MMPDGKTAKRREGPFRLCSLSRKDALGAGTANAVDLRGICQRGFLVMLVLGSQDRRLAVLIGPFGSRATTVLPV